MSWKKRCRIFILSGNFTFPSESMTLLSYPFRPKKAFQMIGRLFFRSPFHPHRGRESAYNLFMSQMIIQKSDKLVFTLHAYLHYR